MSAPTPVAVVGLGGVLPGAPDLETYQRNILSGVDATKEVPPGRWILDPADAASAALAPDRVYCTRGCFIEGFQFDPAGLNLAPAILQGLDPLYEIVLHAGRQAFYDAAVSGIDRRRVGVILAAIALPTDGASAITRDVLGRAFEESLLGRGSEHRSPNSGASSLLNARVTAQPASLLARALGLGGGSCTLDAACASSLYAVQLAGEELRAGRADAMLTGGVSRPECLYTQMGFGQLRALSPSGVCRPFDADADGLVVGEGAGLIMLKRLDDALRDGDHVYGVIRGIGVSNDIAGSLLAADSAGQLRAMRAAYRRAGWRPEDVDLIECHGTGTPLGDGVEFNSLQSLWGASQWTRGQCAIGSVKSNVGHLLTAAGAAGLIKVLLAIRDQRLPPSVNFERPAPGLDLDRSPFRVQRVAEDWPRRDPHRPRRAAVSAFGFGGINAHVLIEEWDGSISTGGLASIPPPARAGQAPLEAASPGSTDAPTPVAIVGMDARFGQCESLRAFGELVFRGDSAIEPRGMERWCGCDDLAAETLGRRNLPGAYIDSVSVPLGEFRLPPNEIAEVLPQQLLMLKSVYHALRDAGLHSRNGNERSAVVIGMGLDLNTTNYHQRWWLLAEARRWAKLLGLRMTDRQIDEWASDLRDESGPPLTPGRVMGALGSIIASRIAREYGFGGPSFAISAEEASGIRALEVAMRALQRNEIDTAVVGAVDLTGDIRSILATAALRTISISGSVRPFDTGGDGTVIGEGAVAVVLKRMPDAVAAGDRIYAAVRGIGLAGGSENTVPSVEVCHSAMHRAYHDAGVTPETIGYLETHGSGDPEEDRIEAHALADFYGRAAPGQCAVGSVKPNVGHTGAAAGMASLAKTALCLYHEMIPPLVGFTAPAWPDAWRDGPFHAPRCPQSWLRDRKDGPRRAGVNVMTLEGGCAHVVLEGVDQDPLEHPVPRRQPLGTRDVAVFGVAGDDPAVLSVQLDALRSHAAGGPDGIERIARSWHAKTSGASDAHRLAIAMVANGRDDLLNAVERARRLLDDETAGSVDDRAGVFHSSQPLGPRGEVAFVFPGAGNYYVGMGRGVSAQWPEVLSALDAETEHLKSQQMPDRCMPWRCTWTDGGHDAASRDADDDPLSAILGQVAHGIVMSDLIRKLGARPNAAIGYSLGESTALFAMRAWRDRDEMFRRMRKSTLFRSDLVGRCDAARRAWALTDDQPVDWRAVVVTGGAGEVREVLSRINRVYLLVINAPDECVIGGARRELEAAVAQLGCQAIELKGVSCVHCPVVGSVKDAYHRLHLLPTTPPDGIRFYSAARAESYLPDRRRAADSILEQALDGFDFPAVIERAYADGVRVFVEPGPQGSCTRMIRRILSGRTHLARSACVEGEDDVITILNLIAALFAERVITDLGPLYGDETHAIGHQPIDQSAKDGKSVVVPTGRAKPRPQLPRIDVRANTGSRPVIPQSTPTPPEGVPAPSAGVALADRDVDPGDPGLAATVARTEMATTDAHNAFLRFACQATQDMGRTLTMQAQLMEAAGAPAFDLTGIPATGLDIPEPPPPASPPTPPPRVADAPAPTPAYDRNMCMEFAIGSVGKVLGPQLAEVDTYPVRVRLPDEPLMLVDRILTVEARMGSLTAGRVVTEHDVLPGAWYLDGNRAPVCIAVEAGQADLFLCSYLGIDLAVKGTRAYRLLDATVTFHRALPQPGEVVRYDIRIDRFVRQKEIYLFFFRFDATINGQRMLTMRDGCAGFFTAAEIAESGGIVEAADDLAPTPGKRPEDWRDLVPMTVESYSEQQIEALRRGDLAGCFGTAFSGLELDDPPRIPGGRMHLIDRVVEIDPTGGRFGLGRIRAEADIRGDEWFLTCHFPDDMVMPGTLMYECCAHTLRVFLLRMGWVAEQGGVCYEPVAGKPAKLRCRGPVTPDTRVVTYDVHIKEIGYDPEPFVIADALMDADGRKIVRFTDMSMKMTGVTRQQIESRWRRPGATGGEDTLIGAAPVGTIAKPAIFDTDRILAFAIGKPSEAFGEPYRPFDGERRIARLPAPPYSYLDRITEISAEPWRLQPGGWIEAQYDVPPDAWYFAANRQQSMPFAVLLEVALQPCGWLAAYLGSALRSDQDLSFRNLGGSAELHQEVFPDAGTLTSRVRITKVSEAGGMFIESFDIQIWRAGRLIYNGDTTFGFFSADALAQQIGIRDAAARIYTPTSQELLRGRRIVLETAPPLTPADAALTPCSQEQGTPAMLPAAAFRMIDALDPFIPDAGPHGLGYFRAVKDVVPNEWFFTAHFHQDPVWPGSLGLESLLQCLKVVALERWGRRVTHTHRFEPIRIGAVHRWVYRGQILPRNQRVEVEAVVTSIQDDPIPTVVADGFLKVDGVPIYEMVDFGIRLIRIQ